jgi:anti-sigma28 factor (negative regulator of flagellin synthesis)
MGCSKKQSIKNLGKYAERGFHPPTEFKKGYIPWNKGKKVNYTNSEGMLKYYQTHEHCNKGKTYEEIHGLKKAEEIKQKITHDKKGKTYEEFFGNKRAEEIKKKIKNGIEKYRKNHPEWKKECLKRRTPSSLEIKMMSLIKRFKLPYAYVGNGKFWIEKYNPDFINNNGEKIAIETFCREHKQKFRGNVEGWKRERIKVFNKYGWKVLFFDETDINEKIIEKINL